MVDEVLVSEIVASLVRRGFATGLPGSVDDLVTQVLAVDEELGEVARMGRRIRQGVDQPDMALLTDECADVLISAVCLASTACEPQGLARIIKAKLAKDEQRGFLHRGGPLSPLPAPLLPVAGRRLRTVQKKAPFAMDLWEFWGGNDLGKALRDAADFIDGFGGWSPGEAVETVYCSENDQGWFVSVLVKDIFKGKSDATT